jgi:Calcineurin-like phosphoesterase
MSSKSGEPAGIGLAALTPADLADLPEPRVAIAGDWHGNVRWLQEILPRIRRTAPDVKTILHLGDLGVYTMGDRRGHGFLTAAIPYWLKKTSVDRILVTPGNHEQWPLLSEAFDAHPGAAAPLVSGLWAFPRGFRFTMGGRTFLSFSGAATYDTEHRTVGKHWWPDEDGHPGGNRRRRGQRTCRCPPHARGSGEDELQRP